MNKIIQWLQRFMQGRYGMDNLGKTLWIGSLIIYLIGGIFQNQFLLSLGWFVMLIQLFRSMSRKHWDRQEENRKYNRYIKLWKLRYKERKTSRIYVCTSCGRFIRVPKGKGKIRVTCTVCGNSSVHRT